MLTVHLNTQREIFKDLLEFYIREPRPKVIDLTYGIGCIWASINKDEYNLTTIDRAPDSKAQIKEDFTKMSESRFQNEDALVYDPPHKYTGKAYSAAPKDKWTVKQSEWTEAERDLQFRFLNEVAIHWVRPGGILFAKMMDVHKKGVLIPTHSILINTVTNGLASSVYGRVACSWLVETFYR